jgi:hypothetical protein
MKRLIVFLFIWAGLAAAQSVTVTVTWGPASNEPVSGFVVSRGLAQAGPFTAIGSVVAPSTCASLVNPNICTILYTDANFPGNVLTYGTTYWYTAAATMTGVGTSAASAPASVTTLPAPVGVIPAVPRISAVPNP